MKIKPSTIFLIFLLIIMVLVIGVSLTYTFQSAFVPLIMGGLGFVLVCIELWKELSVKEETVKAKDETATNAKGGAYVSVAGWLFCFPFLVYLLGFVIATPLCLLCDLKLRRRTWKAAILLAVSVTVLVYLIFELCLKATLWKGIVFGVIEG